MDPVSSFVFSASNLERIKAVLLTIKSDLLPLRSSSNTRLFDVLASILNEAMEQARLVPSSKTTQLEDIVRNVTLYERLKKSMQNLLTIATNPHLH